MQYASRAISVNTARTYSKPVERYQAFCTERGWDPAQVQSVRSLRLSSSRP